MGELVEPLVVRVVECRDGERAEVEEVCVRRVSLREDEVLEGDGAVRLASHPPVGHRPDEKQGKKLISIINTSVLFSDTTKNGGLKNERKRV